MFGAIISVIVAFCKGAEKYAKAFEASGDIIIRVTTVADKHVQNWEFEQDAIILDNQAKVKAKLAQAQITA